jgi:formate dehydrogenase major subunit
LVADPNVSIQESKAFTGNLFAGRLSFGRRAATDGVELRQPEPPCEPPRDKPRVQSPLRIPSQEPPR